MGAKLKSKEHLQNTFFEFLSRFLRIWLQSLQKVLILPQNLFFLQKIKKDIKKRIIPRWFRIRWKSCNKMHQKKVTSKTSLTNMSESEKSAYFRHVFANNFFWVHFFKTFSTDSKSAWNSAFFDTHNEFFDKNFFLLLLALFVHFDCKCAGNGSQKRKIFFLWMCLRILLGNIKGFA